MVIINAYLIIAQRCFSSSLKINHDKTKVLLVIGFPAVVVRYKALGLTLNLSCFIITYSDCDKNLKIILGSELLFFKDYIKSVSKSSKSLQPESSLLLFLSSQF